MVNMLGKRFYDETGEQFSANNYNVDQSLRAGQHLNAKNVKYKPSNLHRCGDGRHRRRP